MKLILGSSSKSRRKILEDHGFQFEVMNPDIDEKEIRTINYYKLSSMLAHAKLDALIPRILTPSIVITTDQVVVCNNTLHDKPQTRDEVRAFFKKYSEGHPAETVSAVVVFNTQTGKRFDGVDIAKTYFSPIPEEIVEKFIDEGDPFSKAGGFAIQSDILEPYIKNIEGTKESIMGMPVHLLKELMKKVK
jgi:septum formation protein